MLEDIRLTDIEITDSKMEYFPVTIEDRNIANTATDKANRWWLDYLNRWNLAEYLPVENSLDSLYLKPKEWQVLKEMAREDNE